MSKPSTLTPVEAALKYADLYNTDKSLMSNVDRYFVDLASEVRRLQKSEEHLADMIRSMSMEKYNEYLETNKRNFLEGNYE